MLVRLLYVSRAVDPNSTQAIDAILASARNHNLSQGITGILCYGGGIFLQAIEGGRFCAYRSAHTISWTIDAARPRRARISRGGAGRTELQLYVGANAIMDGETT